MLTCLSASISGLTLNPRPPGNNALSSSINGLALRLPAALCSPPPSAASCRRGPRSTAVMMAKREEELKEIRTKSTDEINEEVVELKGELFMLRLLRSTRNEFKASEFRRMRKRIARMLTVKREREIEEGINKRISRKLDRKWKKSIIIKPPPSLIKMREEEEAEEAQEAEKSA
ncbi:hypothetical protein MLD38_008061 [Melastoma candidum]|uniref:Uncharacterized protein n=1 Tax=Melastoma candidum TaxID=119954 RepID=A0ACB9RUD9_9MYRT|nr:hypothetical protein MLD38_008061 [Melastoma candidum]